MPTYSACIYDDSICWKRCPDTRILFPKPEDVNDDFFFIFPFTLVASIFLGIFGDAMDGVMAGALSMLLALIIIILDIHFCCISLGKVMFFIPLAFGLIGLKIGEALESITKKRRERRIKYEKEKEEIIKKLEELLK